MDIKLTDNDVQKLLVLCKEILTQYNIQLEEKCKGTINITATNSEKSFVLSYFVRPGKVSLNFRETEFN
ncbi:hypothetical protein L1G63_002397, partial [Staphylococcus pseudintermedius]|nr:hypothetical protein [Staphylococcus pseudintermedius]